MSSGARGEERIRTSANQPISLVSSPPLSPLRIFRTAFPATRLAPFASTRCVKEAISAHYCNLGFAIEDVRGLNSNFNGWEGAIK
jgi:hypothetical protein